MTLIIAAACEILAITYIETEEGNAL